jgi:spermidine/putrescine transport system permease protein
MSARAGSGGGGRGLLLYAFAYLAFLYVPVLLLPLFSFNDSLFIAFPLKGFTTKWYAQMLADDAMLRALVNTLKVGSIASLASTALALLAARALTRYRMPGRGAILGLANLPLFIPEIVLGISLLILLTSVGIPLSLASVVIAHILICIPFALAVLMSRLEGFDPAYEEASRDLGENAWMTFWRVTFPIALPGIVSSLLLTFLVSFDDFLIAFFLSGTEATLPVFIWGQLRFPFRLPGVLALGATILLLSGVLVVIAERLRRIGAPAEAARPAAVRG